MATFRAMNTDVTVLVPGVEPSTEDALARQAAEVFAESERVFSRFLPESELARLNRAAAPTVVSPVLFAALERARAYWQLADGWFDPTIGGVLCAAGYDRSFDLGPPDRAKPFEPLPGRASFGEVDLDPARRLVTMHADLRLDCGGFIKGWTVDQAANLLPTPSAVDAGGDTMLRGPGPDGDAWVVDVEDPAQPGRALLSLRLRDQAVATSGSNRRRWRAQGEQLHHLIDPHTGAPAKTDLVQVSVVARSAELADVLAKTAFLRGQRDGARFLERFDGVSAVCVSTDGAVRLIGNPVVDAA